MKSITIFNWIWTYVFAFFVVIKYIFLTKIIVVFRYAENVRIKDENTKFNIIISELNQNLMKYKNLDKNLTEASTQKDVSNKDIKIMKLIKVSSFYLFNLIFISSSKNGIYYSGSW